jgi:hypothetical protein
MMRKAGHRIEGVEWEETLLYAMASNDDFFGTRMNAFNEKMLYKNFLKVVEIPPIAKLDAELMFDIKFYARFLAIFISKMKKDWAKIDSDMNGKGMKKAQSDYDYKNILKWSNETDKRKKHMEKHPEHDDSINDGLCEVQKESYRDKIKKKVKKKRMKRYRKLWGNCVPLSSYKGKISINQKIVLDRRRRYEEEKYLYERFVINQKEKKEAFQATIKDDSLKVFHGKPYERKCDDLVFERDAQTIDQFSAVDGSDVAVEDDNLNSIQIRRQSSAVECTPNSEIGTIRLTSGTSLNDYTEEVISSTGFGTFYKFREVYSFISSKSRRTFKLKNSLIES